CSVDCGPMRVRSSQPTNLSGSRVYQGLSWPLARQSHGLSVELHSKGPVRRNPDYSLVKQCPPEIYKISRFAVPRCHARAPHKELFRWLLSSKVIDQLHHATFIVDLVHDAPVPSPRFWPVSASC